MARAIGEGLSAGGLRVELLNVQVCHRSDAATQLLDAGALIVGSSTLNNQMLPIMADVMTYVRGLKPRNLVAAAFGSYGWSGEAPKQLHAMLTDLGAHVVADPLRVNYVPDDEALARCRELGREVAAATLEACSE